MISKFLAALLLLASAFSVNAGDVNLVLNGQVVAVAPVTTGQSSFYAVFEGSTNSCGSTVVFKRSTFPTEESYARVYSTLLVAMAASYTVSVNGLDNTEPCSNGNFVYVKK